MRVDKTIKGCTCPQTSSPFDVAVNCPVHFGDGYGNCIPHMIDVEELRAAVDVCCGVGLCRVCLSAHFRKAHAVQ